MKTVRIILLISIFSIVNTLVGEKTKREDYTMPSGKVLKNAYVMETKPNGVVVWHDNGVMFVKYSKMPASLKKELGYNPEKYAAYEKKVRLYKKRLAKKRNAAIKRKRDLKIRFKKSKINELKDEIITYEMRIKFLKREIPKLEAEVEKHYNTASKMATVKMATSDNTSYAPIGSYGVIMGRSNITSTNRREVRNRQQAMKLIADEYSRAKFKLANYKQELEEKSFVLIKLKAKLKELQNS